MAWWDFFKVWTFVTTDDPISVRYHRDRTGAGISQADAVPDMRGGNDGTWGGGSGAIRLRDTNDFVDLSTVTNRIHRYKEYERLRNMSEIETVMTVFADEACFAGDTKIATPHGYRTLRDLAQNEKERFLVYCYDFAKRDYTLGWAHSPRKTKTAPTIKVYLDNGLSFVCTPDHKILLKDGQWKEAGKLEQGSELMPFYRIPANQDLTNIKTNQYPRIFTNLRGWIHERQFVDEYVTGKTDEKMLEVNKYCRMIAEGLNVGQLVERAGHHYSYIRHKIEKHGFTNEEMKWLGKKADRRRVLCVVPGDEVDVYDLTVDKHHNFATEWGIAHNCQKDDNGRVFKIETKNTAVKEELEYLLFHRKMLNFDQKKLWNMAKQLFIFGDFFYELVIDIEEPKAGVLNLMPLPADSMYRIETTKGKLIEFQQSKEGPDFESLARVEVTSATDADLQQAKAIRFAPDQIIHMKVGDDRKTFYPYGVSLIEAARGPAHQLRMMEDSMVIYRLIRAPERRVFYVDVQGLPSGKAEAFVERMKDQLKKKKVPGRSPLGGASAVEERFHIPPAEEDIFIPVRNNSTNTRVETLPGAQNLGEIDDTVYFRNKLFTALNFPKNYFNNEDTQTTRIALSAQDIKFARMIERLQSHIEDGFWDICDRHLRLLGYPEEVYEDLVIRMTPPSDWRELTRAEVITNRITNATGLKQSELMSDFDILTKFLMYDEVEARKMLSRLKLQKLDDLKMQIIAQNPGIIGVGLPGANETQIGSEAGGPNPMLGPDQMGGMGGPPPMGGGAPPMGGPPGAPPGGAPTALPGGPLPQMMRKYMDDEEGGEQPTEPGQVPLPDPDEEDIKRFDLDIQDFEKEVDEEEQDVSEQE